MVLEIHLLTTQRTLIVRLIVGYSSLIITFLNTARILIATNEMLNNDDDELSVTMSVNEQCPSDAGYDVLVEFGTQSVDGGVCIGQMNASIMTITPGGPSVTFTVDANTVTLGDDEVYCYMTSINGTVGEYSRSSLLLYYMHGKNNKDLVSIKVLNMHRDH